MKLKVKTVFLCDVSILQYFITRQGKNFKDYYSEVVGVL